MSPSGRIDERNFFVSGEAEVDEPLAVERAGHLFQNLDAPLVVFDQIVVGRQDARDPALDWRGGGIGTEIVDADRDWRLSWLRLHRFTVHDCISSLWGVEKVEVKLLNSDVGVTYDVLSPTSVFKMLSTISDHLRNSILRRVTFGDNRSSL